MERNGITRNIREGMGIDAKIENILVKLRRRFGWHLSGERLERLRKLYVGKREEEIYCIYYGKMCKLLFSIFLLGTVFSVIVCLSPQKQSIISDNRLIKENPAGNDKSVKLKVSADEYENEMIVQIPRQTYTKEQIQKQFCEIKQRIEQTYLGENRSPEKIEKPLVLMTYFPESGVSVKWDVGNGDFIKKDGTICNKRQNVSKQVEIRAILSYGEEKDTWVKQLTVLPVKKTKQMLFWEQWEEMLERNKERESSEAYLTLPQKVNGQTVHYDEEVESQKYIIIVVVCIVLLILPLLMERNVKEQLIKREEQLQMDYPDFVEKMVLLMGAGLTVHGAWQKIVTEYMTTLKSNREKRFLYEEMHVTLTEMENGLSETRAYELFGKRTGILCYMKLTTLLVQNLKKGSADLLEQLEYEVEDAFRVRKENAKTLGEKAGTKLLLPMALMLGIVFALILYAAFQGM